MVFVAGNSRSWMVDMNITPLVDVMLVLLIIFMVAMPKTDFPIGVKLPQAGPYVAPRTSPIDLKIDAEGQITWNGSALPMSALGDALKVEAERYASAADQPVVQIDTDKDAQYDTLAKVLATARNAGLDKIGFVDNGQH